MSLKKRIRLPRTLSFRLTLWYGGIFTLSAATAFFLLYLLIASVLRDNTDRELLNQMSTFSSILRARGMNAVRRVMILEAQAAGERKIFFRLLYLNGLAFSSSNMSYWQNITITPEAVRQILEGQPHIFETVSLKDRKHHIRVLYGLIGPGVILQLGQPMEHTTRFIEAFQKIVAGTMCVLAISAALIGWFMARKALSGLAEVTRTAMSISGKDLHRRVPVTHKGDEIDRLATTFNQMLDRIESLITGVREMSDNIAHDLKSPVTRIRGLAEITLTSAESLEEYEQMAASTVEECDRLLGMITTMLMISKTETGTETIQSRQTDLAGLVRDACALFEPMAEDNSLSLICHTPARCGFTGDVRLIQRMIANLLDNAIRYTPGGWVHVAVESLDGKTIEIIAEDTGIGIAAADLPHVFERFYRCDPSRSRAGTGLGLSLARAIATAHGGTIRVTSTPGRGSVFTVALPRS
ncbi:two-component sensor histidine kinase [Desulfonema ishimotonii]|uniref:histidine kinase n=1 Tax=Desulfonema ishimotonii TaxID=45657 RepID=A0A401FTG3_9BACT|nr:ATP-binding protein [Desulfonema ishimotonii]GBC60262.1 two-component sensor histidine kinase [Desulfonema ishimotonii]